MVVEAVATGTGDISVETLDLLKRHGVKLDNREQVCGTMGFKSTGLVKGIIPGRGLSRKSRGGRDKFWLSRKGDYPEKGDFAEFKQSILTFGGEKLRNYIKISRKSTETRLFCHFVAFLEVDLI